MVGDDDVLVRVHAAAVHPGDYFLMTGVPYVLRLAFGLRRPRNGVPGMDVAGRVEAVGRNVQGLELGDEVFGWSTTGTLAEYAWAPADNFAPKPANLTMEQAAAVPMSAFTALQALRDIAKVQPGQTVLITGASGGGRWVGPLGRILRARLLSLFTRQTLRPFLSRENRDDLLVLSSSRRGR